MRDWCRVRTLLLLLLTVTLAAAVPMYTGGDGGSEGVHATPATANLEGSADRVTARSAASLPATAERHAAVDGSAPAGGASKTGAPRTDSTVTRITVFANRTAVWEVEIRTRLPTNESVERYRAFQAEFRANTSRYLSSFRESMVGVVASAENATGREMHARNFQASTSIQPVPRRWGVVTYEFTWDHFAVQDGRDVVVGDAFGSGFYLTENDTLAINAPDEFVIARTVPAPDDRSRVRARWFGPRSFATGRPSVRFEPRASTTTVGTQTSGDGAPTMVSTTTTTGPPAGSDGSTAMTATVTNGAGGPTAGGGVPVVALVAIPLVIVGFGAYRYYGASMKERLRGGPTGTRTTGGEGGAGSGRAGDSETGGDSGAAGAAIGADQDDSTGAADASATRDAANTTDRGSVNGDTTASGTGDSDDADTAETVSPGPVLTDEQRVVQFLEDNGGQVRQSDVVDGLGWSKSKTSRVLSDMADEDEIEKLRIGRENIISLPEEVSDDADDE